MKHTKLIVVFCILVVLAMCLTACGESTPTPGETVPAVSQTPEATPEVTPTSEPTAEPTPEATPTAEPTAEPTPEATSTAKPTAEPTPTPGVADPSIEPTLDNIVSANDKVNQDMVIVEPAEWETTPYYVILDNDPATKTNGWGSSKKTIKVCWMMKSATRVVAVRLQDMWCCHGENGQDLDDTFSYKLVGIDNAGKEHVLCTGSNIAVIAKDNNEVIFLENVGEYKQYYFQTTNDNALEQGDERVSDWGWKLADIELFVVDPNATK